MQVPEKVLPTEPKNDSSPAKDSDDVQGEITYPDGKVKWLLLFLYSSVSYY